MLNNIITLTNFKFFVEFFLILRGILITIVFTVLKTKTAVKFEIHKPLGKCMALIFLMGAFLIINEFSFNYSFNKTNLNLLYSAVSEDILGIFVKFLICIFSSIFFYIIVDFLDEQKTDSAFLLILYFAMVGLVLLCVCNDLLSAYLTIELISLSSYLLASFKKESSYSVEAGLKYFVIGSISSAFFLLGSSLIYASSGTIYFLELHHLFTKIEIKHYSDSINKPNLEKVAAYINLFREDLDTIVASNDSKYFIINTQYVRDGVLKPQTTEEIIMIADAIVDMMKEARCSKMFNFFLECEQNVINSELNNKKLIKSVIVFDNSSFKLIELGILFILFSIFIKLALAPFHLWSLDVYEGSPTISTFFFAVMTKLSLFMFLIRFCYTAMPAFIEEWQFYSIWIATVSLFVGSFGGLKQRKLKTLLAYSSINHMGYSLLAFSTGSFFGIKILIIYLIIYMISGICIWFSFLLLRLKKRKNKYSKELSDLSLLGKSNPALAFSLAITFFSIAGLPPFIGFVVKTGVFLALLKENFYFFCVLAVLCSVISTFYYIRIIKIMFFENILVGKLYCPIKSNKIWLLSFFTFLLLFIFINPKLLFLLIHLAIESN